MAPLIILYENQSANPMLNRSIQPLRVNRTRRKNFVDYFEVIWAKMNCRHDVDLSDLGEYVTLEALDTFEKIFPELVLNFRSQIEAKKNTRSKTIKNI